MRAVNNYCKFLSFSDGIEMTQELFYDEISKRFFKKFINVKENITNNCNNCSFPCFRSGTDLKPITYEELEKMGYIICEDYEKELSKAEE